MDLRRRWWRSAFGRPHVFVLSWPGATSVRLAAEAFLRDNGWPTALSPADTDILLIAAPVDVEVPAQLSELADRVWVGVPKPCARLTITDPTHVAPELLTARTRLADPASQRAGQPNPGRDAGSADDLPPAQHAGMEHAGMEHAGMEHAGMEHAGMEHAGMEHAGIDHAGMEHAGMEHAGMEHAGMDHGGMAMPAGLPLADEGADRDGLNLDVLRIALGPALPNWPAGLRLMLTVQGDVVVEADVEVPEPPMPKSAWWSMERSGLDDNARAAARRLDSLTRLFAIAGADRLALTSARIRDRLLAGAQPQSAYPDSVRLLRRSSHSPLLTSMTKRIPLDSDGTLLGLPAPGDVSLRWTRWLEETATALSGGEVAAAPAAATLLAALPRLVVGRELAEVRLVVAALDPDLDELVRPMPGPARPAPQSAHAHA